MSERNGLRGYMNAVTEQDAVGRYRLRIHSQVMIGAFRKGFRARRHGHGTAANPYARHAPGGSWGRRCWDAWLDGWRAADA